MYVLSPASLSLPPSLPPTLPPSLSPSLPLSLSPSLPPSHAPSLSLPPSLPPPQTQCVVDHINYYMDLSKTSETTPPIWEFEYSAKADYRLADLQPQSWADLVLHFQTNNTFFMQYFQ